VFVVLQIEIHNRERWNESSKTSQSSKYEIRPTPISLADEL
jgi:hypothetical protein